MVSSAPVERAPRRRSPVATGLRVLAPVVLVGLVVALLAAGVLTTSPGERESDAGRGRDHLVDVDQIPSSEPLDVPSALDDLRAEGLPDPAPEAARLRSGGPPPDGIPAIDRPRFQHVDDVDWLADTEPVLVFEHHDGVARAYPVQIMIWHEIVNDTIAGTPITVSYCPLCNSAIAYDRRLPDGTVLDFGTSGMLLNSALVMYDRQSESLWSHFTGDAIAGHLTGAHIQRLPIATVAWSTFRTRHPDGLVLSRATGHDRDYGMNPYPGYDDVDGTPFLYEGEVDGRLAAQTRVVAVRGVRESVVLPTDSLARARVGELTVDGRDLVALYAPGTSSALDDSNIAEGRDVGATGVFDPMIDGRRLHLAGAGKGTFRDVETGSTWDVLGVAIRGPLRGRSLTRVEHLDTFWFAIAAFEPDARIIEG